MRRLLSAPCLQIVELSVRLIVMWSVPFNLNLYDTYLGIAMIYNQVNNNNKRRLDVNYKCRGHSAPLPIGSTRCTTPTLGRT